MGTKVGGFEISDFGLEIEDCRLQNAPAVRSIYYYG
jgi:hypothetical protein